MLKALSAKPELVEVRTFYDYGCVAVRLAHTTTLYPRQEQSEAPSVVQGFWQFRSISDWLGAKECFMIRRVRTESDCAIRSR